MAKHDMNLQDSFLNQVRKDNTEIQLVLLDGARLTGLVRGFDNFTVIVNARGNQHLIYKHAIAQIISRRPQHYNESLPASVESPENAGRAGSVETGMPAEEDAPTQERQRPPREGGGGGQWRSRDQRQGGGRPEGHRGGGGRPEGNRGGRPQRDNREQQRQQGGDRPASDKFNSLDLSNIKVESNEKVQSGPAEMRTPIASTGPVETQKPSEPAETVQTRESVESAQPAVPSESIETNEPTQT